MKRKINMSNKFINKLQPDYQDLRKCIDINDFVYYYHLPLSSQKSNFENKFRTKS